MGQKRKKVSAVYSALQGLKKDLQELRSRLSSPQMNEIATEFGGKMVGLVDNEVTFRFPSRSNALDFEIEILDRGVKAGNVDISGKFVTVKI